MSLRRDPGYCRTNAGGTDYLWNPLPHHRHHKARIEEAKHLKAAILREGEKARRALGPKRTVRRKKEMPT